MKTKSFLRKEEYKRLAELSIDGKILDVGGSKHSGYHGFIKGTHTFTVGNIDESYGIDVVFDAQETWPFPDGSYDAVLFINLLEHLYRYDAAVDESFRVLKSGGRVVGVVPFLFNVHGSPYDYFRFTKSALERMLSDAGYEQVEVKELGTGAFSVAYHAFFGLIRWPVISDVFLIAARSLDTLLSLLKPGNLMSAAYMPLGYYFEARKR